MALFKAYFKVMRHSASKNEKTIRMNRKTGARFIGKSSKADKAYEWMLAHLLRHKFIQKLDEPIHCDINAKLLFYFPKSVFYTKKNERSKKLTDLDNCLQLVIDCLQKAKIIENDTQIVSFDGSRRLPIEGTEYFIDIELEAA